MRLAPLLLIGAALGCGPTARTPFRCAEGPRARPDGGSLLADPTFALASWDSGELARACLSAGPWGGRSWGVEAASFLDSDGRDSPDRTIDRARLSLREGAARVAAGDVSGRWSFARFIQGDVWGGTSCGPVSWNRFEPIVVASRPLSLDFDVCLEDSELGSLVGSWILAGVNVWLSAPSLAEPGRDRFGRKPLVLDLMVHHRTSMIGVRDGSHEDELAYHYQTTVAEAPQGHWTHVSLDLTREVLSAAQHFALASSFGDLAIHQVELVVEVHDATAAMWVRDARLH